MQTIDFKTKQAPETDSERPEVPDQFTCVDPAQKRMVRLFLSNLDPNLKEQALVHLKLCLHCREFAAKQLNESPKESSNSIYTSRVELDVTPNHVS